MAKFTQPSIGSSYRSNEPPDDGTESAANEITWAKHVDKIADPLKDYADAINQAVEDGFGTIFPVGIGSASTNYTVQTSDNGKLLNATNTITITLPAAEDAGIGFLVWVRNSGSGTVTIDGNASELINGATSLEIPPGGVVKLTTNGSSWSGDHVPGFDANDALNLIGALNHAASEDVASAATTNIGAAESNNVKITGTTGITAFDTVNAGIRRTVRFAAALTLTHDGTSLILPGAANIITAANDTAEFLSLGSGNWVNLWYTRASGKAVDGGVEIFTSSGTFTAKVTGPHFIVIQAGGGGGGGGGSGDTTDGGGGGGGGGGGEGVFTVQSLTAGTDYTVTIGAGGAGGTPGTAGTTGGASVFGARSAAGGDGASAGVAGGSGGGGGAAGTVARSTSGGAAGGAGATAGGSTSTFTGNAGGGGGDASGGGVSHSGGGGAGGYSLFGAGGIGGDGRADDGGANLGNGGGDPSTVAFGAGGGGASGGSNANGGSGGDGQDGIVIVIW